MSQTKSKKSVLKMNDIISIIGFTVVYTVAIILYFYLILNEFVVCVILAGVFYPFAITSFKRFTDERKIKNIEIQFGEALRFISTSLSAGTTIENSFYDFVAKSDSYNKSDLALIVNEFKIITNSMDMHESITTAFGKFAERSRSSDIKVFSLAFSQVCLSGGDMIGLVRNTSSSLRIKRETEDEIALILSGPKYNHRVITAMPVLIISLMKFISPDYVESMYAGPGRYVAVCSAILIVIAYIIGEKLSDIRF